jgi:broad specificity phosphatase PhoE
LTGVWCSTETKARETALAVVAERPLAVHESEELGENDRSATGYLPGEEFEQVADLFFAHPHESVRGWERAIDAQRRIVAAVAAVLADERSGRGDVLVVAHGAVGALLLCHLRGVPITLDLDQPGPGGNLFEVARATVAEHRHDAAAGWRPLESML